MKDRRTHRSCNPLLFAYRLLPGDTQKTQRKDNDAGLLNHLVEQLGCTWLRRPVALDNLAFLRGITARSSPAPSWVHLCRRLAIVCTALQV